MNTPCREGAGKTTLTERISRRRRVHNLKSLETTATTNVPFRILVKSLLLATEGPSPVENIPFRRRFRRGEGSIAALETRGSPRQLE